MRVGLVGLGRWGQNLQRVLEPHLTADLNGEADTTDPGLVFRSCEAVAIATPPETHYQLARAALEAGVWTLLVEKPLTLRGEEARHLSALAASQGQRLAVGHVQLHAAGYQRFRGSTPKRIVIERLGWNPGYHGVTAWWDLAPHDVAVCVDLLGEPESVEVEGDEDYYEAELSWPGARAVLIGSRRFPEKRRRIVIDQHIYDPTTDLHPEPLQTEVDWWLAGGQSGEAVTVVEVLERGAEGLSHHLGARGVAGRVPEVA